MTEQDLEIQRLRREIRELEKQLADLRQLHFLDRGEIQSLRWQISALLEEKDNWREKNG